jgi:hypothetical protein
MATQWPVLKARLVELLPTLAGWPTSVYDGPPVTGDNPTTYATVGYQFGQDEAGSFRHERHGNGFQVVETGDVRGELVCRSGDSTTQAVEVEAFGLLDALDAAIRADQTLGVLPVASTTNLSVSVAPEANQSGAVVRLRFSLEYETRS